MKKKPKIVGYDDRNNPIYIGNRVYVLDADKYVDYELEYSKPIKVCKVCKVNEKGIVEDFDIDLNNEELRELSGYLFLRY